MNPATAWARVVVDELLACGLTDAVLAPGSRNAPLSVALADADATGRLRLHVRIDERTAGFLAIGLARGSQRPVVVVTTSGTAVANLHPAVLEAAHGHVPLVVLSADRPPWLRDVGANQTVDQKGIFGSALRFFHEFAVPEARAGQHAHWRSMTCRAWAAASGSGGGPAGPVQLNAPLAEPLLPDGDHRWPERLSGRNGPWTRPLAAGSEAISVVPAPQRGERVLFVADLTHPWAASVAEAGQLVVTEAGGAAGRHVLAAGVHLLSVPGFVDGARPDRVVVLGRPTLFRPVQELLADSRVVVDVIGHPTGYADPAGSARVVAPGRPDVRQLPPGDWAAGWRDADAAAGKAVADVLDLLGIGSSPRLARELAHALPERATLVLGSSQPPRDLALSARARDGLRVVANRGVAGIDGTVSTAIGVALTAGSAAGPTVALLGDLTFLHDITGLVIGPDEPTPDLTVVVSNNDGGAIFGTLEPGEPAHAHVFERVFGTPHGADLGAAVRALGHRHEIVDTPEQLADALRSPSGLRVVEVRTSRTDLAGTLSRMADAVRLAV